MTPETPDEALQRLTAAHEALMHRFAELVAEQDTDENEGEEPDAPVPVPLLPRTPLLAGGNARRLEEAIEESEP